MWKPGVFSTPQIALGEAFRKRGAIQRLARGLDEEMSIAARAFSLEYPRGAHQISRTGISAMTIVGDGVKDQHQDHSIPFEFVDDDELACIEDALHKAHSMSFAYHSAASVAVLPSTATLNFPQTPSAPPSSTVVPTGKFRNSFVYTVAAESARASTTAAYDSQESVSCATVCEAGSEEPAFFTPQDVLFSQLSVNYAGIASSSRSEDAEEEQQQLSNSDLTLALDRVESSPSCSTSAHDMSRENPTEKLAEDTSPNAAVVAQGQTSAEVQDIEDSMGEISGGHSGAGGKSVRNFVTLLERKSGRGLSVTDFTASEWCEKQVEFTLNRGRPEQTPAMKAGSIRHVELEKEVVTRVDIEIFTKEDAWAVRLLNFISGARQLLSEGITRELPVLGAVGGTWVVGIIDEIRLVQTECGDKPLLVDTKTRRRRAPPSEPQKRNARLQLMCYKMLWDTMVERGLPTESFFNHFKLNPRRQFCQDIKSHAASFWTDCKMICLGDLLQKILTEIETRVYPKSVDSLILSYELQEDHSLLGEDEFYYEREWLMDRWHWHSHFWSGQRPASFVSEDETWKCRYCSFASVCLPTQQQLGTNIQESKSVQIG